MVCHDVWHCSGLRVGEEFCVSFRVYDRGSSEEFAKLGSACRLAGLSLDTTIQMQVWATREDPTTEGYYKNADRRACGEARIPLRHLVSRCDGAIYHQWMNLDSPGLADSVAASAGLMSSDAGEAFGHSLLNAPRQLFQPKACISICKAEDLASTGQALWTSDAPRNFRIANWGPLVRSQQQHVAMCVAQNLHNNQALRERRYQDTQQRDALESQVAKQGQELQVSREQLRARKEALLAAQERNRDQRRTRELRQLEEHGDRKLQETREMAESCMERMARQNGASGEVDRLRETSDQLVQEIEAQREELEKLRDEATQKLEAANTRIRALRKEKEDAMLLVQDLSEDNRKQLERRNELLNQKRVLGEEKEQLLKIFEGLNQACVDAGLPMEGRMLATSITMQNTSITRSQ